MHLKANNLVPITEARSNLTPLIEKVNKGQPVILTKQGKAAAVLISASDFDQLQKISYQVSKKILHMSTIPDLDVEKFNTEIQISRKSKNLDVF
jgi:prevent-host-death family protein